MANEKSEFAYNAMRNLIIYKKWAPGESHSVVEVANKLKISRTPVAEAVKLLEAQGLVKTIPHKGFIVSVASESDMQETFEIKAVLEGLAAKKAAQNPDPKKAELLYDILHKQKACLDAHDLDGLSRYDLELHLAVFRLAKSSMLEEMATSFWHRGHSYIDWIYDWKILGAIYREHEDLVNAIVENRAQDARTIMEQHGNRYAKAVLDRNNSAPDYGYEQLKNDPALAEMILVSK